MNDDNDGFRRRLERIAQERGEQKPTTAQRPASRSRYGVGSVVGGIIRDILLKIVAPLVVFFVLPWYVLHKEVAAGMATLLNPNHESDSAEQDFAVRFGRLGAEFGEGQVANAEAKELALGDLASGGAPSQPDTPVSDVQFFDANVTCQLRRPAAGEKLANVYIRESFVEAPLRAIRDDQLLTELESRVGQALSEGEDLNLTGLDERRFEIADVYVTDTSAPLYLVLQSNSETVWNIHTAAGVTISHIAMVSGGSSGLAGDIGGATFEAIRASDFGDRPEEVLRGNQPDPESYDCMAWPFQKPNETWTSWKGAQEGDMMDGHLLFGEAQRFAAYEHWYREMLGASPNDNAVITASARAALVGPIPATPIAFSPQDGLQLRLDRFDTVFTGTPEELTAQFNDHLRGILNAAAGGDYADITRPEIDLSAVSGQDKPAEVTVVEEDSSGGLLADLIFSGGPWERQFEAMIDMTTSNIERRVGFRQSVHLEDLLAEGEAMPPENRQRLYVMLRIPRAMEYHCQETLIEIAAKCRVLISSVHKEAEDAYAVDVDFGYVPNYSIGVLEKRDSIEWGFVSAFLPDLTSDAVLDTPEKRKAFLRRLAKVCDTLRDEIGNCVVSTVGFELIRPALYHPSDVVTWAAGWVSVYAPDNPFEADKIQKRADEVWAQTN
jgi:hypothetical protein